MGRKTLKIHKNNGKPQRSDTALTREIANALMRKVLSGHTLFPREGDLALCLPDGDGEKTLILPRGTLTTWITRNNVIPETGEVLRDVLDGARTKYRINEREKREQEMVDLSERRSKRLLKLRTNQPAVGTFGVIKDEDGNVIQKENVSLLREQMKEAKFIRERLDPERYGRRNTTQKKSLTFSLSELRKYHESKKLEN